MTVKNRIASAVLAAATAVAAVTGLTSAGCSNKPHPFTEGKTFAGNVEVNAHDLNQGYEAYMLYCYACHGEKGDGKGPASYGLKPPPRDFTTGAFKFARLRSSDELPHDADLFRIVRGGLHGTAMLPWDIPDVELDKVIQYIKTFAPQKWEKRKKSGELVKTLDEDPSVADPWAGKAEAAVQRGKELYHFRAECMNCHPAYDTKESLYKLSVDVAKRDPDNFKPIGGFRDAVYQPVAKDAEVYKQKILPPDFLLMPVRSVCQVGSSRCPKPGAETTKTQLEDLFRLMSYGVYPVMPAWKGAGLSDEDIWALAHYVKSLMDLRGSAQALEMKTKFASQPAFQVPAPTPPPEEKKDEATEEKKDDEKGDAKKDGDKKDEKKKDGGDKKKDGEKKEAKPPAEKKDGN